MIELTSVETGSSKLSLRSGANVKNEPKILRNGIPGNLLTKKSDVTSPTACAVSVIWNMFVANSLRSSGAPCVSFERSIAKTK